MIVIAAATPWESRPLARALGLRAVDGAEGRRWSGAGGSILLVETGMGPARAAAAMDRLAGKDIRLVVSAGFAGSLSGRIAPGDVVADLSSASRSLSRRAPALALESGLRLHDGPLASSEKVLADPAQKRALGQRTGAGAVDMESAALRDWAKARGAAFAAVRVVLDGVDERLPSGEPGPGFFGLLGYASARWRELPLLARLGLRQRRAMAALGGFLLRLLSEVRDEPDS